MRTILMLTKNKKPVFGSEATIFFRLRGSIFIFGQLTVEVQCGTLVRTFFTLRTFVVSNNPVF